MRTALVLIAALGLAACNNRPPEATSAAADNATTDNSATADTNLTATADGVLPTALGGTPSTPDFVTKAAMSDMLEIESAKVALARTKNAAIRKFADKMVAEHTATTAKVKEIVAKDELAAPPEALDADHRKMLDDVKSASAADFDRAYLDQQTKAHSDALSLMRSYANGGDNADLKAFAAATAPKVSGHLDMVKALDKSGADGTK